MKILAVDLGDVRTGIAVCDREERLASPLCVIEERRREALLEKIVGLCGEHRPERLVVGYPRNMDGSAGASAQKCEAFAAALGEASGIETVLWDERCTTISAIGYLNATNTRGKKRKAVVDAAAASIILQDYLDFRRNRARMQEQSEN